VATEGCDRLHSRAVSTSRTPRPLVVAICAGLVALCATVYAPVLTHGFADLDDLAGIQYNDSLVVAGVGDALERAFTDTLISNWMPVTVLSHQLDHAVFGMNAAGHHATSLVLHTASSVLLFLVMLALTGAPGASAFIAAVFAVHPLHVETVAWISERKGAISGLFFVLTLGAHARYAALPSPGRYAAVVLCLVLALLSKPTTVTLPCVLLLLDVWPLRRLGARALIEKLPLFALVAGASITTYLVQQATGAMRFGERLDAGTQILNALGAYASYLGKTFWPAQLAAFYRYEAVEMLPALLAGALLLTVTAAAWWLRERAPYLLVGWLWFLGMLVPMLGLVQVGLQSHADRYMYLPLIGLTIAMAFGVRALATSERSRLIAVAAGTLAVAALAIASWVQLSHWADGFALWNRVLEVDPASGRAHRSLGSLHARRLEFEPAEAHYLAAHVLEPEASRWTLRTYFTTKAGHLSKRGDSDGAVESYRAAHHYDPDDTRVSRALGMALVERGEMEEAIGHLERRIARQPRDLATVMAYARAAEALGRIPAAVAARRHVLEFAPDDAANRNDLAWLLATTDDASARDPKEAVRLAETLTRDPEHTTANQLDTLSVAYEAAGRIEDAHAAAARALDRLGQEASEQERAALTSRLATLGHLLAERPR